ncbi:ASCH domain-containing protein [Candidatus Woesearchaeota archaeon]|nr:ASCH domain-containing protein [Candidatus Woesearchaeota archaeon]
MVGKTFFKRLHERPFNAIKEGKKTVEIRANKNEFTGNSVNLIEEGDTIIFRKMDSDEQLWCTVERKTLYKSVRELLEAEGIEHSLSSTTDLDEGIRSVESIGQYKELISKNGVFAIKLANTKIVDERIR